MKEPLSLGRRLYLAGEPLLMMALVVTANWALYLVVAPRFAWVVRHIVTLNTALFLYVPFLALAIDRLRPSPDTTLDVDRFGLAPETAGRSFVLWLKALAVVAPLFALATYVASLYGPSAYHPVFKPHVPEKVLDVAWFHLVHVALPEEFFFRGYVLARLDMACRYRVSVLGTPVGPGLLGSSVLFALVHPMLGTSWWNLDTFFPGLLFGWLKLRSSSIVAPVLMHWASNMLLFSLTD